MSGMFQSKKQEPSYSTVYDPFSTVRGQTSGWLSNQIGQTAVPYTGEMVAPKTAQESQSADYLNKYVSGGTPQGTALANEEVRKTMQNEYDPASSPYYQAVKAESARNLEDSLAGISSDAAGGGRYWSGARLGQQGEARTDVANSLNTLLGQMSESERARRLQAVPYAAQLGKEETQLPLQKATALQSLGSLDRNLAQAQDEATYNEWLRQQQYPIQTAQLAAPYAGQQPVMAQQGYGKSQWDQVSPFITQLLGSWLNNQSGSTSTWN